MQKIKNFFRTIIKRAAANPALTIGAVSSLGLLLHQVAIGELTWTVAVPGVVALVVRSFVSPAFDPGFVARNVAWFGAIGSIAVTVGQALDTTIAWTAVLPLISGFVVAGIQAAHDPGNMPGELPPDLG